MWQRTLLIISNLILLFLFLGVMLSSRRPLCIDSRLVESIDILTSHGQEEVFACYRRKSVPFSPYLSEMLPVFKDRIRNVEVVFKAIGGLKEPVLISVDLVHPWIYEVNDHNLKIGEQLFLSEGHLEKGLFKIWYNERDQELFAYAGLARESVTDLLLFLAQSELNIEDRLKGFKTKLGGARWPQVIKSPQGYCDSPWKLSEHYESCVVGRSLDDSIAADLMANSLRPLISSSLIESYQQLSFSEKNGLLRGLSTFVSSRRQPPLNIVGVMWESHPSAVLMGREILREVQEFLFRAKDTRANPSYKLLVSHFTDGLRRRGFQEASSEIYFDFIYESAKPLKKDSKILRQLRKIGENRNDIQMAATDGKSIWFLPSEDPVKLNLFKEIHSYSRMVENCGNFDFNFVFKYANEAEKLIVIDNCNGVEPEEIQAYLIDGSEGFARNNRKISFVQFHIPSLELKADFISAKENVVALIQNRDINNPTLQALGWQELYWEKQIEAYRPKAQIEAIQWFRF